MHDRYGNDLGTRSESAVAHYCAGVDLFLAAQPGGIEKLQAATVEDDGFAVAHADLARALQVASKPKEARAAMDRVRDLADGLSRREKRHVAIIGQLIDGQGSLAYDTIRQHVLEFPRDVMTVQPCCGVFGLIGFSGRSGREAENAAFMTSLAHHYEDDWWFGSQFAFALAEVGELNRAGTMIERAFAANPANANAAHYRAHVHYETGEARNGLKALSQWRQSYDRRGLLHCHLAWHDALWALELGDVDRVWEIVSSDIHPDVSQAPPINRMTDLVAILLRSELAGCPRQPDLWQTASDYAARYFPQPGLSFADAHSVIAHAMVGDDDRLKPFRDAPAGPAGDQVACLSQAYTAFLHQDWQTTVDRLTPVMASHERLGGSRAQRDLLELTLDHALARLGAEAEANRPKTMRRQQTRFSSE